MVMAWKRMEPPDVGTPEPFMDSAGRAERRRRYEWATMAEGFYALAGKSGVALRLPGKLLRPCVSAFITPNPVENMPSVRRSFLATTGVAQ